MQCTESRRHVPGVTGGNDCDPGTLGGSLADAFDVCAPSQRRRRRRSVNIGEHVQIRHVHVSIDDERVRTATCQCLCETECSRRFAASTLATGDSEHSHGWPGHLI
jgi:hypothetical protein